MIYITVRYFKQLLSMIIPAKPPVARVIFLLFNIGRIRHSHCWVPSYLICSVQRKSW